MRIEKRREIVSGVSRKPESLWVVVVAEWWLVVVLLRRETTWPINKAALT